MKSEIDSIDEAVEQTTLPNTKSYTKKWWEQKAEEQKQKFKELEFQYNHKCDTM